MPIIADEIPDILHYVTRGLVVDDTIIDFHLKSVLRPGWSEDFHLRIMKFNSNRRLIKQAQYHRKEYPWSLTVALPRDSEEFKEIAEVSLVECIHKRRSQRDITKSKGNLGQISSLLGLCNGLSQPSFAERDPVNMLGIARNHPSGGARYPLETYLFAQHVDDLAMGFYHYNVNHSALELISTVDDPSFLENLFCKTSDRLREVTFALFFTAVPIRSTEKYGHLGYRLIHIEVGHLAQSLWLVATALGLKCWPAAFIDETLFFDKTKINSHQEFSVYNLLFGR